MLDSAIHHTVHLDGSGPADYRSVVAFFARQLLKDLRLVGGYDVLYPKVRDFMRDHLFDASPVDLEDPVVIRNLSEPNAGKILYDSFKAAMNALTISDTGTTRIEDYIRLQNTRPFRTEHRPFLAAQKSIFTKIVGEVNAGGFELAFAAFLEAAPDVATFTKNYLAIGFKFDYVKANGDLSNYVPDFIARDSNGTVWIIETKGREELDLPQKMARLGQWCADATAAEENGIRYDYLYVDQASFDKHKPVTLTDLVTSFTEYR
jgi:type III restriction enzyme